MKIARYKTFIGTSLLGVLLVCVAVLLLSCGALGQSPPQSETPEEKSKRGESLFHEASRLFKTKTPESLRAAAAKFLEAKSIFQELGQKQKEGFCLTWLGGVSAELGERRTALEYFIQALRIYKTLSDKPNEAETRFSVGNVYVELGDDNAALEHLEPALKIFSAREPKDREIDTLEIIGKIHHRKGNGQKAVAFNEQALAVARSAGDKKREAEVMANLGNLHLIAGDFEKALKYFEEMLALARKNENKRGEAEALELLALAYRTKGDMQKALAIWDQSKRLARALGDKKAEAKALNEMAETNLALGHLDTALKLSEEALKVSVANADIAGEGAALLNIGIVRARQGEYDKALDTLKKAADLLQATKGDFEKFALARMVTGGIYYKLGDKRQALEVSLQALTISKIGGFKHIEVEAANNIGGAFFDMGESEKALEYYRQALPLAKELRLKDTEARILLNIGNAMRIAGDNPAAIEYLQQAAEMSKSLGYRSAEIKSIIGIGGIYLDLGENEKALGSYMQAMSLALSGFAESNKEDKETAMIYGDLLATILNNLGRIHSEMGARRSSLDYYLRSLAVLKQIKDRNRESITLTNIAGLYFGLGENEKATEFLNQAMAIAKETGNRSQEATILNSFGAHYSTLGNMRKAAEYYSESLLLLKIVGDPRKEAVTLSNLRDVYRSLGQHRVAILYGKLAVNVYQELRSKIRKLDKETQRTYLSSIEYPYRGLAASLINEGRPSEAQQVLNAFKDQQFFDLDPHNVKELKPLTLTPRETDLATKVEKASRSAAEVGGKEKEIRPSSEKPAGEKENKARKLNADTKAASENFAKVLKQLETELTQESDEKDKVGEVADTVEMLASLNELEKQTGQKAVAFYQLVGVDNFHALIISSDQIKSVSTPVKNFVLNDKATQLWALLQSPAYDTTVLSKEIYDIVFKPLEPLLPKDTTTIMWSLDGSLRYVPMAALFDGKKYLVERYNHAVFTRADRERMTRNVSPVWTGSGFGSSRAATVEVLGGKVSFNSLPGVTEELSAIFKNPKGGVLEGAVLKDKDFNRASFLGAMKQHRPLVHIASHFNFRPGDESRSFLLLGDGTAFTLDEMKRETNLFQGVELLTLSACNTAAQQVGANGREIDGFAEMAQRLGAGAVMATLWQVSDAGTSELMIRFYKLRTANPQTSKGEAFRQAQLSLLGQKSVTEQASEPEQACTNCQEDRTYLIHFDGDTHAGPPRFARDPKRPFAHPYYWAPFVLFGNWR